jgi:hypothetical protein
MALPPWSISAHSGFMRTQPRGRLAFDQGRLSANGDAVLGVRDVSKRFHTGPLWRRRRIDEPALAEVTQLPARRLSA